MELDVLLRAVEVVRRVGPSLPMCGVEYDSRRVGKGSLFVAMQGGTTDGNCYIPQAVAQGATAILTDSPAAFESASRGYPEITLAQVRHGRAALAAVSANFFAHPERGLKLSGVTGTNGKTTTAFLLEAMLRHQGRRTVLIGTIEYHVAEEVRPSPYHAGVARSLRAVS